MKSLRFVAAEAWYELRAGCRGPLIPIVFPGLIAYLIRTRGIAGPFALAALLMLIRMVAMVVVRGGDASPTLATLLDPSAFAEVEEQTNLWTPREKAAGVLQMTTRRGDGND